MFYKKSTALILSVLLVVGCGSAATQTAEPPPPLPAATATPVLTEAPIETPGIQIGATATEGGPATVPDRVYAVVGWYGTIIGTPDGAQFDDYVSILPEGVGEFGIEGADDTVRTQIRDLRDSGTRTHLWGTLTCGIIDYGGCQLLVSRLRPDGPGPFFDPDPVEGWEGLICAAPTMPQVDDFFVLAGAFPVQYGIWSGDAAIASQLESLRDSGTAFRVWGEMICGIPDANGCQIQVTRIELVGAP